MKVSLSGRGLMVLAALSSAPACSTDVTFYTPGPTTSAPADAGPDADPVPVGCPVDDWNGAFEVGRGYTCFTPVSDGETLEAEPGPQGGAHYWMAVRCRGCTSTTTVVYGVLSEDTSEPVYTLATRAIDMRSNGDYLQAAGLQAVVTNMLANPLPAGRFVLYARTELDDGTLVEDRVAFTPLGVTQSP